MRSIRRVEKILFSFLIVLLPSQLGKHTWPSFAYVNGIRIDYLSPTLYLTDLILVALLLVWFINKKRNKPAQIQRSRSHPVRYLLVAVGLILVNSLFSSRPMVTIYSWVRFAEVLALFWYVMSESGEVLSQVNKCLPLAVIYQSLLAIAQVANQGSLGGPLYALGERSFSLSTPGIATTQAFGRLMLRPYATFPHPNALAGFLLIALLLISVAGRRQKGMGRKSQGEMVSVGLGLVAIFLTCSQSAWIGAIALIALLGARKHNSFAVLLGAFLIGITLLIGVASFEKESLLRRLVIDRAAIELVKSHPFLGVGLGNFIPSAEGIIRGSTLFSSPFLYLQPVHNIYLLAATETGLLGGMAFMGFLLKSLMLAERKKLVQVSSALLAIILLGMVDHYWITLQQTRLLLTILVAIPWGKGPYS